MIVINIIELMVATSGGGIKVGVAPHSVGALYFLNSIKIGGGDGLKIGTQSI